MFQHIPVRSPLVRSLPYPYLGALSIANDIEFASAGFFEPFLKFLNGRAVSPLGQGLGLEVTSSFFFYTLQGETFAYFASPAPRSEKSAQAPWMEECIRTGWFDTLHAYGNFDGRGGFTRPHAEAGFEALDRVGATVRVFTNHGDEANVQNVGGDAAYHAGDLRGHAAYHADLLHRHGVRYLWTDSMIWQSPRQRRWRWQERRGSGATMPLLERRVLRDGGHFLGFRRFRSTGENAPNLSSFGAQLRQIDLAQMYASHGVSVIYQHFGVLYRQGGVCVPASIEAIRQRPEVYLAPFRTLAREQGEGRLWVAGLARLLTYGHAVQHLTVAHDAAENHYRLSLPADDGLSLDDLQGVTLYVDTRRPVKLSWNGTPLAWVQNGPDETGRYSVSLPMRRLDDLW